jgi:hypothetical protein
MATKKPGCRVTPGPGASRTGGPCQNRQRHPRWANAKPRRHCSAGHVFVCKWDLFDNMARLVPSEHRFTRKGGIPRWGARKRRMKRRRCSHESRFFRPLREEPAALGERVCLQSEMSERLVGERGAWGRRVFSEVPCLTLGEHQV